MGWQPIRDALLEIPWDIAIFINPLTLGVISVFIIVGTAINGRRPSTLADQDRSRSHIGEAPSNKWEQQWRNYRSVFAIISRISFVMGLLALIPLLFPGLILSSLGISSIWQLLPNGVSLLEQRIRILGWSSIWLAITIWLVVWIVSIDPADIMQSKKESVEKGDEEGISAQQQEAVQTETVRRNSFHLFLSEKDEAPPHIWLNNEKWWLKTWREIDATKIYFKGEDVAGEKHPVTARTDDFGDPNDLAESVCLQFDPDKNVLKGRMRSKHDQDLKVVTYDRRSNPGTLRSDEFFWVETQKGRRLKLQFSLNPLQNEKKGPPHEILDQA